MGMTGLLLRFDVLMDTDVDPEIMWCFQIARLLFTHFPEVTTLSQATLFVPVCSNRHGLRMRTQQLSFMSALALTTTFTDQLFALVAW